MIIKLVSACGGKIERSLDFPWWLVFGPEGPGSDTDSVDLVSDSRIAFALDTTVFGLMEVVLRPKRVWTCAEEQNSSCSA